MDSAFFLDVAQRIASRLCDTARWFETDAATGGPRCTWSIQTPDYAGDRNQTLTQEAPGDLYQGNAGIAYFLGRLWDACADAPAADRWRRSAEGGLRQALHQAQDMPDSAWGFHGGRLGVVWVACRLAPILELPELRHQAEELLRPMLGQEFGDHGLDVIAGAAGAIPALLDLRSDFPDLDLLTSARRCGEHLIRRAHQEPDGWSWGTITETAHRHLTGFAHGTSGIGLAFLELEAATGDARFRFAAHMAFLYEDQFFDAEQDNWPDLRNVPFGELLRFQSRERLQTLARAGSIPEYRHHCMVAWCHGAPGIGLSRLRAWRLTGESGHLDLMRTSLVATLRSIREPGPGNFSQCHGHGGNVELPLWAARELDEPKIAEPCLQLARAGAEHFELADRPWPCGTLGGVSDPGLMLGEAGIGLFYLRLVRPEIPTPLLLQPDHGEPRVAEDQVSQDRVSNEAASVYEREAQASAKRFFASTLEAWKRLDGRSLALPLPKPIHGRLPQSPARATFEFLVAQAERADALHRDAFKLERRLFELAFSIDDFSLETRRSLLRPDWSEVNLATAELVIAAVCEVLHTDYSWGEWLRQAAGKPPQAAASSWLLARHNNRMNTRPLQPLTAVIMQGLATPQSARTICALVAEAMGTSAAPEKVRPIVHQQLEQLYRAGFLDARLPETSTSPTSDAQPRPNTE